MSTLVDELNRERIREEVHAAYPGLEQFLSDSLNSLYAALWFGLLPANLLEFETATSQFLAQWRPEEARSDVKRLDLLADLVLSALDDAWEETAVSGAVGQRQGLQRATIRTVKQPAGR